MSVPVTVATVRRLDPAHSAEMIAWVQAGISLAERFDGFLGAGWVRPREDSDEWHMLYRFASDEHLAAWEASPQRAWWLAAGQGRIETARVERLTGIEGWFDEPLERAPDADAGDEAPVPAPPRWKQACVIFLVFYPLSLLVNWLSGLYVADVVLALRVLLAVLVMTPVMTYVALPWITRRLQWWLRGDPPPWRRRPRSSS